MKYRIFMGYIMGYIKGYINKWKNDTSLGINRNLRSPILWVFWNS